MNQFDEELKSLQEKHKDTGDAMWLFILRVLFCGDTENINEHIVDILRKSEASEDFTEKVLEMQNDVQSLIDRIYESKKKELVGNHTEQ